MAEEKREIFRKQSLDKLSSPERLDQMLRIVKPQSWVLLFALSVGACLVVVWAIVGIVPATANGPAILVRPKQVTEFHSPANGQIKSIEVSPGDAVQKDQVLATLELPTLEKDLEVERMKLALVSGQGIQMTALEKELAETERQFINRRREVIARRIEEVQTAADRYKERNESYLAKRQTNLETAREQFLQINEALEKYTESLEKLVADEVLPENSLIRDQTDLVNIRVRLADLNVTEEALRLRESEIQEYYDRRMDLIRDLEIEMNDLEIREVLINRRLGMDELQNERQIEEIKLEIERLAAQLESDGKLVSEHRGSILEITVTIGHQVAVGQALGKMAIDNPAAELQAIAFLPIKDGMKIQPGQKISVSPTTVERERFGGIEGQVESRSPFPITLDAATHEVGDQEIARDLLGGEPRIKVVARLELDPTSSTGFLWTSGKGPNDIAVTQGTTANVRVTLEERAPITLVLPFLKSLFGL